MLFKPLRSWHRPIKQGSVYAQHPHPSEDPGQVTAVCLLQKLAECADMALGTHKNKLRGIEQKHQTSYSHSKLMLAGAQGLNGCPSIWAVFMVMVLVECSEVEQQLHACCLAEHSKQKSCSEGGQQTVPSGM